MTSPSTPQPNSSPSQRQPLLSIENRKAKFKHETPLIKKVLRKTIKELPLPGQRHHGYPKPLIPGEARERGSIETRRLSSPKQFDNAVRILNYVRSIKEQLFCYIPHSHGQDREALEIQLRHTRRHTWRVVDGIYSRAQSGLPPLPANMVQQLRRCVVTDVRALCAVHIACRIDVAKLTFFESHKGSHQTGLILDAYDLDICSEQDADWAQLEKDIVREVEAQFLVMEFLAKLGMGKLSEPDLNLQFDPGAVLRVFHARFPDWPHEVQQVSHYTPEKASDFIIDYMGKFLVWRLDCKDLSGKHTRWESTSYANAIEHLLRLTATDEGMQQQQDVEALRHLAILRILEAATLVWLHTKITEHSRRKDFPLLSDPYIADSYASSDGFGLVMKAYGEARDAIQALHRAGGKLEDAAYYLHDTRPTV